MGTPYFRIELFCDSVSGRNSRESLLLLTNLLDSFFRPIGMNLKVWDGSYKTSFLVDGSIIDPEKYNYFDESCFLHLPPGLRPEETYVPGTPLTQLNLSEIPRMEFEDSFISNLDKIEVLHLASIEMTCFGAVKVFLNYGGKCQDRWCFREKLAYSNGVLFQPILSITFAANVWNDSRIIISVGSNASICSHYDLNYKSGNPRQVAEVNCADENAKLIAAEMKSIKDNLGDDWNWGFVRSNHKPFNSGILFEELQNRLGPASYVE